MFRHHDRLKSNYDAVIISGGGHGLAAAYYLARDYGMTNIAVLEKGYLGSGNTGRNTMIIRSNYLTSEGVKFYDQSVRLWQDLSQDFDLNVFYSTRGHFTLAHTDASVRTMRWRAETNKHFGIESEFVEPDEVKTACPPMDLSCGGKAPVMGALYHAPGSIARHDAVAWGYGRGANQRGVEIHQQTEVLGIQVEAGKVTGLQTTKGAISTPRVLCAVAGFTPRLLQMVGLRSPLYIHPLQAMVSEPMKPWLDPIIVSGSLHVYVSQTARGELVMGASLDPYELHSTRSTLVDHHADFDKRNEIGETKEKPETPMPEKFIVNLNTEEREYLHQLTHKGKCPARVFKRAHILLLADEGHADETIAQMLHVGESTVHRTRQKCVDGGVTNQSID